jgi:uncharacterized protein (TIGR00255 family)
MIYSMTGFASATRELASGAVNIELRSVNHRYLDLQFRLPEDLRPLEPGLRELIMARLQRGKVECRIGLGPLANAQAASELNTEALKQLRALSEKLRAAWPSVQGPYCRRYSALAGHARLADRAARRDARGVP